MVNYMKCVGLIKDNGIVQGILAKDEESGEELQIKGKAVVNATDMFIPPEALEALQQAQTPTE